MPKVTIIIPSYNAVMFIGDTIASCLNQTFDDFELLIVDDGSTDRTQTILQTAATTDQRIKILHQSNKGPNGARNYGLREARGEWVKLLDHDDQMPTSALEHLYDLATKSEADIAFGQAYLAPLENTTQETANISSQIQKSEATVSDDYFKTWANHTFNETLFRTEAVRQTGGLNEKLAACEEHNLFWRMWIQNPRLVTIRDETYVVLIKSLHPNSHAIQTRSTLWPLASLRDISDQVMYHNIPIVDQTKELLFDQLYETAALAFRNGFREEARSAFKHWETAGVAPPKLTPTWHYHLHRVLGPMSAERLLAKLREGRDKLLHRN